MKPRALITGAGGFLGQHLTVEAQKAWTIWRLDRRIPHPGDSDLICDITDSQAFGAAVKRAEPEIILHLAGVTPRDAVAPADFYRINVLGTLNLLEAARLHAQTAVILIVTSSAMYGPAAPDGPPLTEDSPLLPVNAYGVSKAVQHLLGYQYSTQFGLRVVRACPFNLIGPGLPAGLVAADFARQLAQIRAGHQPPIVTTGELAAGRDFVDVRDTARALRLLAQRGTPGQAYNIASGQTVTIRRLLDILIANSGLVVTVTQRDENSTSTVIPWQLCDNSRLVNATGWQPQFSLEQSLVDTLAHWMDSPAGIN